MTLMQERPLDLREFQDIFEEAKSRIPQLCPEWTDHNSSDPGITIIELFAWMTEMILYQLNRVPDDMYERFLDLVGVQRLPPTPSETEVTFYLSAPRPDPVTVEANTEVATDRTEMQQAIAFTTVEDLSIKPVELTALRAWRQGVGFEDYMPYITSGLEQGPIFNEEPIEGDALYIGHTGDLAGVSLQIRFEFASLEAPHIDPRDPPIAWEYWTGDTGGWSPVVLLDSSGTGRIRDAMDIDPTHGFNVSAEMALFIPTDSQPHEVDGLEATWIRIRVIEKEGQGYTESPRLQGLRSEVIGATVVARQAQVIKDEIIGESDGEPSQTFPLLEAPILRGERQYVIHAELDGETTEWTEVEDFSLSGPQDRHFVLQHLASSVRFGPSIRSRDGTGRQYGAVPRKGAVLRIRSYLSGGGSIGNVGAQTTTQLKTSIPYIANVMNYKPATGGLDEETLDEAKLRALSVLKHTETAVTGDDFERLAHQVEGVGRTRCIIADQADGEVSQGTVQLLLIPELPGPEQALSADDLRPAPNLVSAVSDFLDERKVLGTAISYLQPALTWVNIDVHIHVSSGIEPAAAQELATRRLREFLHPTDGGSSGQGLGFGASITESQIAAVLQGLEGVVYVQRVRLRAQADGSEAPLIQAPSQGILVLGECFVLAEATQDIG